MRKPYRDQHLVTFDNVCDRYPPSKDERAQPRPEIGPGPSPVRKAIQREAMIDNRLSIPTGDGDAGLLLDPMFYIGKVPEGARAQETL